MTRLGWMCGAWMVPILGVACADAPPMPGAAPVATELSGRLVVEGPSAGRRVVVSDLREGVPGAELVSTLTDEQGAWSLVLGPVDGLVRVDVFVGSTGDQRLSAVVEGLSLGEKRAGIQVTPVTHLHAVLLEALRRNRGWDGALAKASELLFGHFGGLDHRRVAAADLSAGPVASVSGEHVVALLLKGLTEQADRVRRSGGAEGAESATLLNLVEAYARDLDDAVLDGRNRFGGVVTFAGHVLTSFWLRSDYADALDAYTDREAERTGIDSEAIQSVLAGLRSARSELFPATEEADSVGVVWVERKFLDDRGFEVASGVPLRGAVELHVLARSPVGIREMRVEGDGALALAPDREPRSEELWSTLDTRRLDDGPHALEVVAETAVGAFRTRLDFSADNHPPEVSVGDLRGRQSSMRLEGQVADASFPVTLSLAVGGVEQGRVTVPQAGPFEAAITIPCGAPLPLSVVGVDLAGNQSEPVRIEAFCDEDAPSLILEPSFFIPETAFELEPQTSSDGVSYRPARGAPRLEISETASQPFRLAKFYNRLDSDAGGAGPNLPTFRVRASDGAGAPLPTLSYRYLVDGVEERGWTPVSLDITGRGVVPVSYQAMSPKLATHASSTHAVEFRAVDPVGNETTRSWSFQMELLSPPVWVSDCRPDVFAWDRLHSLFGGAAPTTQLYSGVLAYPLDLPPDSLTPPIKLDVEIGTGDGFAEIAAVRYIKFQDTMRETTWPKVERVAALCHAQGVDLGENVYVFGSGVDELCLPGQAPAERLRSADRDWAPSARTPFSTTLQVGESDGSPLALDASGRFLWPWGRPLLRFAVSAQDPHVLLGDGARYAWTGTYSDLFEALPSNLHRYWLPGLVLEGAEVPAPVFQGNPDFILRAFRYVPAVSFARAVLEVPSISVPPPNLPLSVPVRRAVECAGDRQGRWNMEWRQ